MNQAQLHTPDYIVVVGYFAILVAIGLYFRRFMRQADDYFTGDKQVPWWLAGMSYYMTTFSAFSFVAYGELAYLYGWVAVTLGWVSVPACLVAAHWSARRWRRARVSTPVEFLEERYSPFVRQLFAWTGFPLRIVDDGLKLYALGVFVSVAAGMDIIWSIVVSAVVLLAYTFFGGLWAVAVTDFVQGIVLYVALLIIFPLALVKGGGFSHLAASAPNADYLHFATPPYTWVYVLGFFLLILLNYNAGWALVQRFYSVKDDGEARKVGLMAAALNVIGPPLFYLPVMLSRPLIPALENTRYAYVSMTVELLPVGLMGIVLTAMLSATMSTLSGEYNVLASVATKDIYSRIFRPDASEEHLLRVGRLFTLLIGAVILGVGVLVALNPDAPLFGIMVTVFGVAVAPMMLPLLGGLLFPRLTRSGAMVGFLVGLVTGFATLGVQQLYLPTVPGFDPDWISFQFGAYAIFINIATTVVAMVLWTLLVKPAPAEEARIQAFFARMEAPDEARRVAGAAGAEPESTAAGRAAPSPFFITGLGVLGIGAMLLLVSFFTESAAGRMIDIAAGAVLSLLGWLLYRTRPRTEVGAVTIPEDTGAEVVTAGSAGEA